MKINSIFRIIQGHQITDEEIYRSFGLGNIPIYTSNNEIKGYWDKTLVSEQDLPCLTYPSKAFSGEIFIQQSLFDANNTAVLIPYPEWREQIILEWASFKLASVFLDIATSKEGVSYLNKEIVEDYDLAVPSTGIQRWELQYFQKLKSLKDIIGSIKTELRRILTLNLLVDMPETEVALSEIFDYASRNDSLSEQGIYQRSQGLQGAKETIKVISGSIDGFYGEIPVDEALHSVRGRPCLQVVTRGKAGQIQFISTGNYATNTNSMLLTFRNSKKADLGIFNEYQEIVMLKFFGVYLQPIFTEYSSSPDLSVFPLTEAIKEISIPEFKLNQQIIDIVAKYDLLLNYDKEVAQLLESINYLMGVQIIGGIAK